MQESTYDHTLIPSDLVLVFSTFRPYKYRKLPLYILIAVYMQTRVKGNSFTNYRFVGSFCRYRGRTFRKAWDKVKELGFIVEQDNGKQDGRQEVIITDKGIEYIQGYLKERERIYIDIMTKYSKFLSL